MMHQLLGLMKLSVLESKPDAVPYHVPQGPAHHHQHVCEEVNNPDAHNGTSIAYHWDYECWQMRRCCWRAGSTKHLLAYCTAAALLHCGERRADCAPHQRAETTSECLVRVVTGRGWGPWGPPVATPHGALTKHCAIQQASSRMSVLRGKINVSRP